MTTQLWQRFACIFIYMLPWSDALPFGTNLFIEIPILQWIALPAFPILILERLIPFGSLLLFIIIFIGLVRNSKVPYFIRFNALQAILIDISIILLNYTFQVLIYPIGNNLIVRSLSTTILLAVFSVIIYSIIECIQGKEPEIPLISQAVKMQLLN